LIKALVTGDDSFVALTSSNLGNALLRFDPALLEVV
jgi:hypothetical protein